MNLHSGHDPRHRAHYDADGDIVLPGAAKRDAAEAWEIVEDVQVTNDRSLTHRHVAELSLGVRSALQEGVHQYRVSIEEVPSTLNALRMDMRSIARRTIGYLSQPVTFSEKTSARAPLNRTTLFVLDVLRFGATFAGIFIVLFVALNYQSFWQLAQSSINPLLHGPSVAVPSYTIGNVSTDDQGSPSGSLLSSLPPVGPPQDRLIIPKLNINVPLVTPPLDSLLNQDWDQVEEDIQDALRDGVVHYPGTAKAGQAGNFFVTGHSSYYPWDSGKFKTVFARLNDLEIGDEYSVYWNGDLHRYRITQKKEVKPTDTSVLDQPPDKRISTLMTCVPLGTALRRLILVAQEVDPVTGTVLEPGEHATEAPIAAPLPALPI